MVRKNIKGITLIVLIITIIILLILAGVTIATLTGENGILSRAKEAKENTNKKTATEIINLKITNIQMETYVEKQKLPSLQELADGLCEDKEDEIEYVITKKEKEQASLKKIEVGKATSIFTKLREYPYEFEINNQLQLASIDGVKIATTNNDTLSTLQEKVYTLSAKVDNLTDTITNLQNSIDNIKSIIDAVGQKQTASNIITATAQNNSTICSLNLTERKIHFIWNGD